MEKLYCIITLVFIVTWPYRNSDFVLRKHFLLLSMLKPVVLLNIFVETAIHFFFQVIWRKKKVQKNSIYLKQKSFVTL